MPNFIKIWKEHKSCQVRYMAFTLTVWHVTTTIHVEQTVLRLKSSLNSVMIKLMSVSCKSTNNNKSPTFRQISKNHCFDGCTNAAGDGLEEVKITSIYCSSQYTEALVHVSWYKCTLAADSTRLVRKQIIYPESNFTCFQCCWYTDPWMFFLFQQPKFLWNMQAFQFVIKGKLRRK